MSTPADNPFQCNGSGKKKQIVQCRVNNKIIKNKNDARRVCGRQPPVREKQCKLSLENCRVPYQWHVRSDWSECSVTCGTDGTEFRDVVCINVSLLDKSGQCTVQHNFAHWCTESCTESKPNSSRKQRIRCRMKSARHQNRSKFDPVTSQRARQCGSSEAGGSASPTWASVATGTITARFSVNGATMLFPTFLATKSKWPPLTPEL